MSEKYNLDLRCAKFKLAGPRNKVKKIFQERTKAMDNNDITNNQDRYIELSIDEIEIDKNISIRANDPNYSDSDEFKEIKNSISSNGILNPITVTGKNEETNKHTLVDGFFRLKAWDKTQKIPSIITDSLPSSTYFSLNYFRIAFTAIERAEALEKTATEIRNSRSRPMHNKEVAQEAGVSEQTFSELRKIANGLTASVKDKYRHAKCNIHALRKIADHKDEKEQEKLIEEHLQEKGITVGPGKEAPEEASTTENDEKSIAENQKGVKAPTNTAAKSKKETRQKKESGGETKRKGQKRPWEVLENHITRALNTAKKIRSRSNLSLRIIEGTESALNRMITALQNECNKYEELKREYEEQVEKTYDAALHKDSGQSAGQDDAEKGYQISTNKQNHDTKYIPPLPNLPASPMA